MFKVGDKVICIDDSASAGKLVNGREYKVTGKSYLDSGDMFVFLFGFGDTNFFADRFKLKGKDMFTLEDIKEGYLVQERSGDLMLVQKNVRGDLFLTDFSNWNDLKLNYKRKELDVMKV